MQSGAFSDSFEHFFKSTDFTHENKGLIQILLMKTRVSNIFLVITIKIYLGKYVFFIFFTLFCGAVTVNQIT